MTRMTKAQHSHPPLSGRTDGRRAPRVLHLSTFDSRSGAARATHELHTALGDIGVESRMLVGRKYGNDPNVDRAYSPMTGRIRGHLDGLPLRSYRKTAEAFWSIGWQSSPVPRLVTDMNPDLVHIHWTGAGFLPIADLARLNRPLVWTLHDMWAFTGGCHYAGSCDGYRHDCGTCPQLQSTRENDLSRRIRLQKRSAWQGLDLHLVPISKWLAGCIRDSGLFETTPLHVIPDGIDTGRFHPAPPPNAEKPGRDPSSRKRILFGSINPQSDPRKGFHLFLEALRRLAANGWSDQAEVVIFGCSNLVGMPDLGMPVRFAGTLSDDRALAALYSSCDVMVAPSLQEAFGITVLEAMACATPVVSFATGGPSETILHRETGYLAEPYSPESLALGIEWCLADPARLAKLGENARHRAESRYALPLVAQRYLDLYRSILRQDGHRPSGTERSSEVSVPA